MPMPRKLQVHKQQNGYYHCMSRVVRRAYLCGLDKLTGQNYEHRRQWIVDRIGFLAEQFAIDICAYAVMSNHYHVVIHVDHQRSLDWDAEEVVRRWWQIFPPKMLKDEGVAEENIRFHFQRLAADVAQVAIWRERLADLSWFMRCLNEPIARWANKEDDCTGRFWEGRFKSQILLDKAALMTCMAYVDLNPVRAAMAESPASSAYCSAPIRLQTASCKNSPNLVPFACMRKHDDQAKTAYLPIKQVEYNRLLEWTSVCIQSKSVKKMPADLYPIFRELEIKDELWLDGVQHYGRHFYRVVGILRHLLQERIRRKQHWFKGQRAAAALYR